MPPSNRPSPHAVTEDDGADSPAASGLRATPPRPNNRSSRAKSSSRRRRRSPNPNPRPRPDYYGTEPSRKSERKRKPRSFPDAALLSRALLPRASPSRAAGAGGGGNVQLWTDADELALLSGAVAFRAGSGRAPRLPDTPHGRPGCHCASPSRWEQLHLHPPPSPPPPGKARAVGGGGISFPAREAGCARHFIERRQGPAPDFGAGRRCFGEEVQGVAEARGSLRWGLIWASAGLRPGRRRRGLGSSRSGSWRPDLLPPAAVWPGRATPASGGRLVVGKEVPCSAGRAFCCEKVVYQVIKVRFPWLVFAGTALLSATGNTRLVEIIYKGLWINNVAT
ncbi:uncharacterized protein [Lolium perenne]|uniref:uncharacterized protein isoform X2 n=1 Tax=Lolium perenne TaxID=4522 RepID=UPI0021F5B0A8|nr:uncharacterized protein LOC127333259 isoform X2 [Lolium perenne]XP_051215591.1 uncharacterized protein LOC127333259 isoform X2 [Lolium perenne]XP_051215592.1 uncharacterized protein LOC127333259 isoform X2 [Lolium perenne]XP_051215593.1 uncharacterized protein LOC127333259 isoform X2 [Lolium perenne]